VTTAIALALRLFYLIARLGRRGPSPAKSKGPHDHLIARLGRRGPSPAKSKGPHDL